MKKNIIASLFGAALITASAAYPAYAAPAKPETEKTTTNTTTQTTKPQAQPQPQADQKQAPSDEELDAAFEKYVDDNTNRFDVEKARTAGTKQQVVEVGEIYNSYLTDYEEQCTQEDFDPACLPIFERWNWCGKCKTDGGTPQNSADQACMNHDKCLESGKSTCECDKAFVSQLKAVRHNYSWGDRAYIEAAIRVVPKAHGC